MMPITILDASHSLAAPLLRKVDAWSGSHRHLLLRQGLTRVALIALPILTLLDVLWHAGAASADCARLLVQMKTEKRTTKVQKHLSYTARNLATTVVVLVPALAMPWKASTLYETVGYFKGVAPTKGMLDHLKAVWKGASSSLNWEHIAVGVALIAGVAIFLQIRVPSATDTPLPASVPKTAPAVSLSPLASVPKTAPAVSLSPLCIGLISTGLASYWGWRKLLGMNGLSWRTWVAYSVVFQVFHLPLVRLSSKFSSSTGVAFGPYLPDRIFRLVKRSQKIVLVPLLLIHSVLGINPGFNYQSLVVSALFEEVIHRGLWQEILMRRVPKVVLSKVSPRHLSAVDSAVGRIVRVVASSLIFAIAHTHVLSPMTGGGLPQFFAGLVYGSIVESTQGKGIWKSTIVHISDNSAILLLSGLSRKK